MKTISIRLTAEQVKKLGEVLKALKIKDCQSYFVGVLEKDWMDASDFVGLGLSMLLCQRLQAMLWRSISTLP